MQPYQLSGKTKHNFLDQFQGFATLCVPKKTLNMAIHLTVKCIRSIAEQLIFPGKQNRGINRNFLVKQQYMLLLQEIASITSNTTYTSISRVTLYVHFSSEAAARISR